MKWKDFWDNPEEIYIGACLQFPLFFVVHWWNLPIMLVCGLLWRLGGVRGGSKLFRRIGVPLVVCGAAFAAGSGWPIFLAGPFMVWLAPSYGKEGILWKWFGKDLPVRLICFGWYWAAIGIALSVR